tara:strand:+ start:190 stop:519 length:330 start_codon:yes stop_codon:yes gene_type:complete
VLLLVLLFAGFDDDDDDDDDGAADDAGTGAVFARLCWGCLGGFVGDGNLVFAARILACSAIGSMSSGAGASAPFFFFFAAAAAARDVKELPPRPKRWWSPCGWLRTRKA